MSTKNKLLTTKQPWPKSQHKEINIKLTMRVRMKHYKSSYKILLIYNLDYLKK